VLEAVSAGPVAINDVGSYLLPDTWPVPQDIPVHFNALYKCFSTTMQALYPLYPQTFDPYVSRPPRRPLKTSLDHEGKEKLLILNPGNRSVVLQTPYSLWSSFSTVSGLLTNSSKPLWAHLTMSPSAERQPRVQLKHSHLLSPQSRETA
jgi:hypothetical protein